MATQSGNLLDEIPEELAEELFEKLVEGKEFRVQRIVSKGHTAPESGWFDQEEHEWVLVVKGEARVSFDNGDVEHLSAGSYLNIPARTKHRVSWTSPHTETVWIAIHYR
ncbi:MAG: cupin domain-containing protein [Pseudomonadota bacterium]